MDFINKLEKTERLYIYPELDSTNNKAKEIVGKASDFTVLFTDFQTAGRGQVNNTWHSNKGENILCSIIIKPQIEQAEDFFLLTKAFSVAVSSVVEEYTDNVCIKWPNDIYINNKKIAGLLVENVFVGDEYGYSIAGVGLNVNQTEFSEILPNPTSLKLELNKSFDRKEILNKILERFYQLYTNLPNNKEDVEQQYFNSLYRKRNYHKYLDKQGNKLNAKILKVNEVGELVLLKESGEIKNYPFKSIEYIL